MLAAHCSPHYRVTQSARCDGLAAGPSVSLVVLTGPNAPLSLVCVWSLLQLMPQCSRYSQCHSSIGLSSCVAECDESARPTAAVDHLEIIARAASTVPKPNLAGRLVTLTHARASSRTRVVFMVQVVPMCTPNGITSDVCIGLGSMLNGLVSPYRH